MLKNEQRDNLPIELKHNTSDSHSTWYLEGHSAKDILQVTGVGMKGRLVKLLSIDDLLPGCTSWLFPKSKE